VDSKVDVENQKEEQRKIFVKNPIAMFNDMAQDFLSQLKTVRRVDNAVCVFYEDLSRNVSLVVSNLVPGYHSTYVEAEEIKDYNVKKQHPNKVEDYISNSNEVEKALRKYPCFHKQFLSEDERAWTIPISKSDDGEIWIDETAECEPLDETMDLVTIDKYVELSLAASQAA